MNSNIITAVILLIFILYIVYENHHFEITQYNIRSNRIPKAFDRINMVILADLHNNKYGKDNIKLLDEIDRIAPDYILVAGDMIVSGEGEHLEVPYSLIAALAVRYPVYYGLGNHEQRMVPEENSRYKNYEDYVRKLEKLGVRFLDNESAVISKDGENIILTGLTISMDYFKKLRQPEMTEEYIQNLVGIPDKKCYNILIAHNPVYFKLYKEWGADLIVAGHLHGGIIRLPGLGGIISPQYKFMPKYDAGMFELENTRMLVSRGLGLHTIKLRINNRPELMSVTLNHIE